MKSIGIYTENLFALFLTSIVAFLTPISAWLILVGGLVMADFVLGVTKAYIKTEEITSKAMFKTIPKLIVYAIAVMIAHGMSMMFFPDFESVEIISGFIAFIEIKSIDENIKGITGQSLFKQLIDKFNPKK